MKRARAVESDDAVKFKFNADMLLHFQAHSNGLTSRVLQFSIPDSFSIEDYHNWYYRSIELAPETVEIFNRVFNPQIRALREDLPRYFCRPLLEGDELGMVVDLFSGRLNDILDQIKVNVELAKHNVPVSSLLHMALCLTSPPLRTNTRYFSWYYPQELIPIMRKVEQHWEGRRQWREALEKAQKEELKYEGPVPDAVGKPDMKVCQPKQENWDMLSDEAVLLALCKTGPHIRYARLVCKRWRTISTPFAVAGILGYGSAFKILSGRATFDELSLRLNSLARMALDDFNRANRLTHNSDATNLDSGAQSAASPRKWIVTAKELQAILQNIDPYHGLCWYRDAQPKFPGLDMMLEAEIFASFIDVRDDLLVSALLTNILYQRHIGYSDSGWSYEGSSIGYRIVRAYLEKYPEAANGHPLPSEDSFTAWWDYKGF